MLKWERSNHPSLTGLKLESVLVMAIFKWTHTRVASTHRSTNEQRWEPCTHRQGTCLLKACPMKWCCVFTCLFLLGSKLGMQEWEKVRSCAAVERRDGQRGTLTQKQSGEGKQQDLIFANRQSRSAGESERGERRERKERSRSEKREREKF